MRHINSLNMHSSLRIKMNNINPGSLYFNNSIIHFYCLINISLFICSINNISILSMITYIIKINKWTCDWISIWFIIIHYTGSSLLFMTFSFPVPWVQLLIVFCILTMKTRNLQLTSQCDSSIVSQHWTVLERTTGKCVNCFECAILYLHICFKWHSCQYNSNIETYIFTFAAVCMRQ